MIEGASTENDIGDYFEISVHRIWYLGEICGVLIGSGEIITATRERFRPPEHIVPDGKMMSIGAGRYGKCLNSGMLHRNVVCLPDGGVKLKNDLALRVRGLCSERRRKRSE